MTLDLPLREMKLIKLVVGGTLSAFILSVVLFLFLMLYPFKTVVFLDNPPINITNKSKMVPAGGVVTMQTRYRKYINNSGLIVRTLVRETDNHTLEVLDSSTVVSDRPAGEGLAEATFVLSNNPYMIGKNNRIIFTIYYTLFGFRPVVVQYSTQLFSICDPIDPKCPNNQKRGSE